MDASITLKDLEDEMKFVIGSMENGKNVSVDALVLADTRALINASSGMGKSWLLRLIAEHVASSIQTIILDPEGEFATLREKLDLLVVGENGDIRADIRSAGLLARRLAETGVSAVIDLYDLPGKGDPWDKRREFMAQFITALMNIPKSLYHPMLIVVDEAHNFAPEDSRGEASMHSRAASNLLMSAGRKRGFGAILATQRISKIHKDTIADARNIFIGGTTLDVDQQRAGDILGMSKTDRVALRELGAGEFYCFGPAIQGKGIIRFQSGPVSTTHPKAGQRRSLMVPKASTQIKSIIEQIGDLPAVAEQEIQTTETLRRDLANAQRELRVRPVQVQPERVVEKVEVPIVGENEISGMATLVLSLNEIGGHFAEEVKKFQRVFEVAKQFKNGKVSIVPTITVSTPNLVKYKAKEAITPTEEISGPGQRILDAIAWLESIGNMQPKQVAVAFLASYTYGGGAFNNPRGALRTMGLVEYHGDRISLTDEGRGFAKMPIAPLTADEMQTHVLSILPGPEQKILRVLLDAYPSAISKTQCAYAAGYAQGGAFNNPLGRLRSLGLIDYPTPGMVHALSFLFLEGQ